MKTLDNFDCKKPRFFTNFFDVSGKVVLLRADLNSDVRGGRVIESERIWASVETLKELVEKGARVVVLAHQGRPPKAAGGRRKKRGGSGDFLSLRQHCKFLNKYVKVRFVEDVCGVKAVSEIKSLKNGEVILLENVRFVEDEFKPEKGKKNDLYKLVEVADVYVNDAFSVCHRKQTSVVLFPRYLSSFAGRLLERELSALKKIKVKDCLYVLGGAKPEDNIKLLGDRKVLSCGLFGQMCLIASGKKLGAQEDYLKKVVENYDGVLKKLNGKLKNVLMPLDFAVKVDGKRKELGLEEFPCGYEIFDIGERTQRKFVEEIKKVKGVFVKGPAGDAGDERFAKGTFELLKVISKAKFSLIGGGHLNDVIKRYKLKGFSHVSLSGGALVRYLAGEKLPGLEALG